jgi:cbb3-type cytochrome oxidase subunit 3
LSSFETMLRVLLANFIVQILPLLLLIAGIVLILRARKGGPGSIARRYLGMSLASLPVGVIAYIIAGIAAAAIRGEGHFYSIPFGGYSASNDAAIFASLLVWIGLVFAVLAFVLRPRR